VWCYDLLGEEVVIADSQARGKDERVWARYVRKYEVHKKKCYFEGSSQFLAWLQGRVYSVEDLGGGGMAPQGKRGRRRGGACTEVREHSSQFPAQEKEGVGGGGRGEEEKARGPGACNTAAQDWNRLASIPLIH